MEYGDLKTVRKQLNMARIRRLDSLENLASGIISSAVSTDDSQLVGVSRDLIEQLKNMVQPSPEGATGTYACPQCGQTNPHTHESTAYSRFEQWAKRERVDNATSAWHGWQAGAADARADDQKVKELLTDVMALHSNPDCPEYNGCDKTPCAWCEDARKIVEADPGAAGAGGKEAVKQRTIDHISNMKELEKYGDPTWRDGFRTGLSVAADWIGQWDRQVASSVGGYRFSDMLLCKFNLTRRKHPRKVKVPR